MRETRASPKRKKGLSTEILFMLCMLWLFLQAVLILIEYFRIKVQLPIPTEPVIFLALLLFAVFKKEVGRWFSGLKRHKKGERFVWGWCIFVGALWIGSIVSKGRYQVPNKAIETLVFIITIYFGSWFSKHLYEIRERKDRVPWLSDSKESFVARIRRLAHKLVCLF